MREVLERFIRHGQHDGFELIDLIQVRAGNDGVRIGRSPADVAERADHALVRRAEQASEKTDDALGDGTEFIGKPFPEGALYLCFRGHGAFPASGRATRTPRRAADTTVIIRTS